MNVQCADPFVLFDPKSGYYYCYSTSEKNVNNKTFYIYKSKDKVNWEFVDNALDLTKNCWGKDWFWAPECYYNPHNKLYYLFYGARVKDELCKKHFYEDNYIESSKLGVATSTSPEGPFVNITNEPIDFFPYDPDYLDICKKYPNPFLKDVPSPDKLALSKGTYIPAIDASLLIEDNRIILYFSRCCYQNCLYDDELKKYVEESNICAVELETDWWFDKTGKTMPTITKKYFNTYGDENVRKDSFERIIDYTHQKQEWENGHVDDYEKNLGNNRRWAEGSTTFTRVFDGEKVYFMTYSCNNYQGARYGVGISTSDSPLKYFNKYGENPIIHQDESFPLYSTGHGSIVEADGKTYYFFHGREDTREDRILYFCEIHIEGKDKVYVDNIKKCNLIK